MTENIEAGARRATLAIRGEIDLSNAQELSDSLARCVEQGCLHITLDMAEVSFVDSTGIATLLRAKRSLPESGEITIVNASLSLRRALAIKAVDRVIRLIAPEGEAP